MGLIKANNPAAANTIAFSMADIEHQARLILSRARSEADQLLAQAKQQADAFRVAAQKEGHAAGLAQGKKEGHKQGLDQALAQGKTQALNEHRAKLSELTTALTKAASELDGRLDAIDETVRTELTQLALAIAARVTKLTASNNIDVAKENIREAVRMTMDKSAVRIAVHPSQRETLKTLLPELKMAWPTLKHVELHDDVSVGAGGCRVTSAQGEIDAAIDAQLERIARELSPAPTA